MCSAIADFNEDVKLHGSSPTISVPAFIAISLGANLLSLRIFEVFP